MRRAYPIIVLLALSNSWALAGSADNRFDIYWIDVEGGAATLMVTPSGESILIDTGNPGVRDPNRIVRVATQEAGLKKIDHLIVTHYHRDHYGGAALLATLLPIGTVYDNGVFDGMPDNPGKEYFELSCDRRVVINPGDTLSLRQTDDGPRVSIICLGTRQQFMEAGGNAPNNEPLCSSCPERDRDGSDNANSVVSLVSFGNFKFFDGGDLTWNQEMKLVCPKDLIGPVDVYQVTHHGLDSSNNPVVLQTIRPRVAIMNNGDRKGCLPEVFANLTGADSIQSIFQVHKNLRPDGSVNNVPDNHIANHTPSNSCAGNFIRLSVAPDALSYQVDVPATGLSESFEVTPK